MANREEEELWMKQYEEASRLADDVSEMLSEHGSHPLSDIRILSARLGYLEADLASLPRQSIPDKEMRKRQEMLLNLKAREKQMASALGISNAADWPEDLPGSSKGSACAFHEVKTGRIWSDRARGFASGFDKQHIVSVQGEILKLDSLVETVLVTKHIALAVNEELNLHTRLLLVNDSLDPLVEPTDSRLQRVQNRVAILNKRNRASCSCMQYLLLCILAVVILAVIAWLLRKYR